MTTFPSGTLSFLFTDIEGSSRLWERDPEEMRKVLPEHDHVLKGGIEPRGGHVFSTSGDGLVAAFDDPIGALEAAVESQRRLITEARPLRVRMALHAGHVEARGGDYFGTPLNRGGRLLELAFGGQILASLAFEELVQDGIPDQVSLRDLGDHRLRDLNRAERVYQVIHPDLETEFPALRSLKATAHNLPIQLTSFVGREQELAEVEKLVAGSRLTTVTGVGGSGKTRLALQAAVDILDEFPDGVWLVDLAPIGEPELVVDAMASSLGVREQPDRALEDTLLDEVRDRQLLLILDNCEHVLDDVAHLAARLLKAGSGVRLLATSREILGVPGEVPYQMRSLRTPKGGRPSREVAIRYDAVRLFCERAETVRPGFRLTDEIAPVVVQICQRLDGLPLAIELATARLRAMSPEEIARRLNDRFRLLSGGGRTALPRHQTLQATLDWSHDLLPLPTQALLRRLSVFRGGFTLNEAEKVASWGPVAEREVLDLLQSLLDKSMVAAEEVGTLRCRLLETVRQYSWEKLAEAGEVEEARKRHLDHLLAVTARARRDMFGPNQGPEYYDRLESRLDDLRAAIEWAIERELGEAALRLMADSSFFWFRRGSPTEGRRWALEALRVGKTVGPPLVGWVVVLAGFCGFLTGDTELGHREMKEGLELLGDDREARGVALAGLAVIHRGRGEHQAARESLEEAFPLLREFGLASTFYDQLGAMARSEGDLERSRELHEQGLEVARAEGDPIDIAGQTFGLAMVALRAHDYRGAEELGRKTLVMSEQLGLPPLVASARLLIAEALIMQQDNLDEAAQHVADSVRLDRQRDEPSFEWPLAVAVRLAAARGRLELAARVMGARQAHGETVDSRLPADHVRWNRSFHHYLADQLGHEAFQQAVTEGRKLSVVEAFEAVLGPTRS